MLPMRPTTSERAESGGREPAGVSPSWAQPKDGFDLSSRRRGLRASALVAATWLAACGSEAPLHGPGAVDAGVEAADTDQRAPESGDDATEGKPAPGGIQAPGITGGPYPRAPYGTAQGAIIENLELFGWKDPAAAQFDVQSGETVRLGDFYNPDSPAGEGTEYIMLNAVAAWCGVCRTEYQHLEDEQTYATFAPRGLQIVGVLFEDNNGDPSTFADLSNWSRAYSVSFPFVNDPAFKTGVYFDKSATPMNMLIDARTMEIVLVMTGYNPLIYDEIDMLLTERGR